MFKNDDFEFGLSIALGSTYSGQADAGECRAVAGQIKDGNRPEGDCKVPGGGGIRLALRAPLAGNPRPARVRLAARDSRPSAAALPGGRPVADPVARSWSEARGAVLRIRELAAVERQTAAPDALRQAGLQPLELGDARIDPGAPTRGQPRPVAPIGRPVGRELGELRANLLERQADPLGEHDEGDPSQNRAGVAAVARPGTLRADQPALLVEPERRRSDAAAP